MGHFGAVRDLNASHAGSTSLSLSPNELNDPKIPTRSSIGTIGTFPGSLTGGLSPTPPKGLPLNNSQSNTVQPNWIPKSSQPRSVTSLLVDAAELSSQSKKDDTTAKPATEIQANQVLGQIGVEKDKEDFRITETIMLDLILDDSFKEEVLHPHLFFVWIICLLFAIFRFCDFLAYSRSSILHSCGIRWG
jgi:hypothetical protein